jgi:hypothetical protein
MRVSFGIELLLSQHIRFERESSSSKTMTIVKHGAENWIAHAKNRSAPRTVPHPHYD